MVSAHYTVRVFTPLCTTILALDGDRPKLFSRQRLTHDHKAPTIFPTVFPKPPHYLNPLSWYHLFTYPYFGLAPLFGACHNVHCLGKVASSLHWRIMMCKCTIKITSWNTAKIRWNQSEVILWSKMLIFKRAFHKLRLLPQLCPPQIFWPPMRGFKWGTI